MKLGDAASRQPPDARMMNAVLNSAVRRDLLLTAFHQHKREGGKVMEQIQLFRSKDGAKTWSAPDKLDLLGRLLIYTRQMDMMMNTDAHIDRLTECFLNGNYSLEPCGEAQAESKTH